MSSVTGNAFKKTRRCPSAQALLLFRQEASSQVSEGIKQHLANCDFCAAELHFLATRPPAREVFESGPMPEHLRRLAEGLLTYAQSNKPVVL
jgi:hypothetical protein